MIVVKIVQIVAVFLVMIAARTVAIMDASVVAIIVVHHFVGMLLVAIFVKIVAIIIVPLLLDFQSLKLILLHHSLL